MDNLHSYKEQSQENNLASNQEGPRPDEPEQDLIQAKVYLFNDDEALIETLFPQDK